MATETSISWPAAVAACIPSARSASPQGRSWIRYARRSPRRTLFGLAGWAVRAAGALFRPCSAVFGVPPGVPSERKKWGFEKPISQRDAVRVVEGGATSLPTLRDAALSQGQSCRLFALGQPDPTALDAGLRQPDTVSTIPACCAGHASQFVIRLLTTVSRGKVSLPSCLPVSLLDAIIGTSQTPFKVPRRDAYAQRANLIYNILIQ